MIPISFNEQQIEVTSNHFIDPEERFRYKDAKEYLPSVYGTYAKVKKNIILFIISGLGFLSAFDDLIYAPALSAVVQDLHTTETLGLLTITVYVFASCLCGLIWGVLSDCYGRRLIMSFGLSGFVLSVIGSYFSPNISVFLICRALQGCFICVTLIVGQATIADIYQPNERGRAIALFYGFYFVAALVGPIIGGPLSYHFGWRSTFILVGFLAILLFITYILFVPETQQYLIVCKYEKAGIKLIEFDSLVKPILENPCLPLKYLKETTILPYVFVLAFGYVSMNVAQLFFSIQLSKAPYYYKSNLIGILYLPMSIAKFSGSIIGGSLSDYAAIKYMKTSQIDEGHVVPALLFSILTPVGLIIYGWSFQYSMHVSLPVIGLIICGLGQTATRPGIYSFYTIKYQQYSASVTAANNFVQLLLTSIMLTFTAIIVESIGNGLYFSIIALGNILTTIVPAMIISRKIRLSNISVKHP
ncbi:unnamed protein product [Adineta steineri]|uniref:Major facilitator superfamily (MFS) profile domain-containing protein n=1 Tax=Adineta steineri TaxID=433720 RepID=A0A813ZBD5_9BILA|nr:unnamed protein product [Adineta steineri]CAF0896581.1 unnamed protein product [Adineta steineri]CAF3494296.1 unnamed protein product [Adineta steineri]CAF3497486.1 unnamed protein product [Adineta steineri]